MKSIKRILTISLMLVLVFTTVMGTFSVSAAADVTCDSFMVIVDDDFASKKKGETVSATVAGTKYIGQLGTTAFATLQEAYAAVDEDGDIYVAAGKYTGFISMDKAVRFYGNMTGVSPNSSTGLSKPSSKRTAIGDNETVLQNTQFCFKKPTEEMSGGTREFTVEGFAMTGDSCIYLAGEFYGVTDINISNNIFDIVNENAFNKVGAIDNAFSVIQLGIEDQSTYKAPSAVIENNRIDGVGYAGKGYQKINGIETYWVSNIAVSGNYIAGVNEYALSVGQLGNSTKITKNYFHNSGKTRVYNNITGNVEISGNTFDAVGGTEAMGQWALGIYANAGTSAYGTSWTEEVESVLIHNNVFKNLGNAIFLQGQNYLPTNVVEKRAPLASQVYNNVFTPGNVNDFNFITMARSDASYSPKVYDNYTGGASPKDVCKIVESDKHAAFEFGRYWLNEQCTESTDLLSIKSLSTSSGFVFSNVRIQTAPTNVVSANIPKPIQEFDLKLELPDGASYTLYEDAECTKPLADNVIQVKSSTNTAYAKVNYANYSGTYVLRFFRKEIYSDDLDAGELVVNSAFAQYSSGQMIYVELSDGWYRAYVGHSAFAEIPDAIEAAQKGSIIHLAAGEYTQAITVNKGVIFKGPKAGINPNNMLDPKFGISAERSNMNEEAVFTEPVTIEAGADGIAFDGITFTKNAMITFTNAVFKVNGLTLTNMIFTGITQTNGMYHSVARDNVNSETRDVVITNNRFVGDLGGQVGGFSCVSNALFEGNVFYKNTKKIYFGSVDGSATDVLTFKDNIFYQFTSYIDLGGAGGNYQTRSSVRVTGNRFIDCSAGSLMLVRQLAAGVSFTVDNNSFEGSTKGTMSVIPFSGHSGQSVSIHHNYFGPKVTRVVENQLAAVADCSHNYFAAGIYSIDTENVKLVPYYTNEAMTVLAGDYQVVGVNAPVSAKLDADAKTITYISDEVQEKVVFDLAVSTDAKYTLYADKNCTKPLADNTVITTGKNTVAYVKVSTVNDELSQVYTIQITQPESDKAELLGIAVDGCIWINQGANRYTCTLPKGFISGALPPLVSTGATATLYNESDTELTRPINYTDITLTATQTVYLVKVVSESKNVSEVYTVTFNRGKSNLCDIIDFVSEQEYTINGETITVSYPYSATTASLQFTVSLGATYDFYEDIGANIRKTDDIVLNVGENKVYVKVTAEDGTSKMYTVVMIREDRSPEKVILMHESFPNYTNSQSELNNDSTGKYVGLKYFVGNDIYLHPKEYIASFADSIKVNEGAGYDIFEDYNFDTNEPVGAAISSNLAPKTIQLTEGETAFFIRITAPNGSVTISKLVIKNPYKNDANKIVEITGFEMKSSGTEINATASGEVTAIQFVLSHNATAKVFADRKKTVKIASSMANDVCTLGEITTQAYVKYYVEVTSQTGKTVTYEVALAKGDRTDSFADISKHWAKDFINEAYKMGITNGTSSADGKRTFSPDSNATRQEVAIFICNLMGIDASVYKDVNLSYKDAASISSWATNAVKAVTKLRIFSGDGTNFNPKANISRQEFMTVIVRACALDTSKGKASHTAAFKDKAEIANWAKVYVRTAVAYGLVNGDEKGNLNPTAPITRAEIAKIMVCAKDLAR